MTTLSASRSGAYLALALFLALSVACSSASATSTQDTASVQYKLEDFIAQRMCSGSAEGIVALVESERFPWVQRRHVIRDWNCSRGELVEIFRAVYDKQPLCPPPSICYFFVFDDVTSSEASATVCTGDYDNGSCEDWLLTRRDGQWQVDVADVEEYNTETIVEKETLMSCSLSLGEAKAWIDENQNGEWDNGEQPLEGVQFLFDCISNTPTTYKVGLSNQDGSARLAVDQWLCEKVCQTRKVYAEPPAGFEPITPERHEEETYLFGFNYIDTANPEPTPTPGA